MVFWKGFALECVRATHGDHSMSIKAVLTVLGRAVEETLSVGPLEASTARVRMWLTWTRGRTTTGDGVTDTPEAHAEMHETA